MNNLEKEKISNNEKTYKEIFQDLLNKINLNDEEKKQIMSISDLINLPSIAQPYYYSTVISNFFNYNSKIYKLF